MLRVSFSSMNTARAAVQVLEAYGYPARQRGCEVVTECPTLLALPAIQKRVGFTQVERLDLDEQVESNGTGAAPAPAELSPAPLAPRPAATHRATA